MANEDIGPEIDKAILAEGAKHVRDGSLILVDQTAIRKEFGLKMEHVTEFTNYTNYAIVGGLKRAFTRFGKWRRKIIDPGPEPTENELLEFLSRFWKLFAADLC